MQVCCVMKVHHWANCTIQLSEMLNEHLCFRTFANLPPFPHSYFSAVHCDFSELTSIYQSWSLLTQTNDGWHWSQSDRPPITPSHPGWEADSQRAAVSQEAEIFGKEPVKFFWPPGRCSRRNLPAAPFWSICAKVCLVSLSDVSRIPSASSTMRMFTNPASVNDSSSDCSTSVGLFRLPGSLNCKRILLWCKYQCWPSLV